MSADEIHYAAFVQGNTKITLEYIGEGLNGDYDDTDPSDIPLLRYTVYTREDDWVEVDDGSYCTQLPITITPEQADEALRILMSELANFSKRRAEEMSWISIDDLRTSAKGVSA